MPPTQRPPKPMRHVLALGIGNLLNTDEGIGVHAAQRLRAAIGADVIARIPGFEVHDGGTLGLELLPLVDDATHLLILDAVDKRGQPPGSIIELQDRDIPLFSQKMPKTSEHQVTFQEVLGLAIFRSTLPQHLHLIGVIPESLALNIGLSPAVEAAMDEVVARAKRVLIAWGVPLNA